MGDYGGNCGNVIVKGRNDYCAARVLTADTKDESENELLCSVY